MKRKDLKTKKIIKEMLNEVYGCQSQNGDTLSCRVQYGTVKRYFMIKNRDDFNDFEDYVLNLIGREFNSKTMTDMSIGKGLRLGDIEYDKVTMRVDVYDNVYSKPFTAIVTICAIYGGESCENMKV